MRIRQLYNPLLRHPSHYVHIDTRTRQMELSDQLQVTRGMTLTQLCYEMFATMYAHNGVGLAAIQVGYPLRLCVLDTDPSHVSKDSSLVLINPEIVEATGEAEGIEGCLSLPGIQCKVKRATDILVKYVDIACKERKITADSLLARAIQHEIDHMDGILIIDRGPVVATTTDDSQAKAMMAMHSLVPN